MKKEDFYMFNIYLDFGAYDVAKRHYCMMSCFVPISKTLEYSLEFLLFFSDKTS